MKNDVGLNCDGYANNSTRISELEDNIRFARQRAKTLQDQINKKNNELVEGRDINSAFKEFDPIWESLSPRERTKAMHILVKRVDYDSKEGTLSITLHSSKIKTLAEESAMVCG